MCFLIWMAWTDTVIKREAPQHYIWTVFTYQPIWPHGLMIVHLSNPFMCCDFRGEAGAVAAYPPVTINTQTWLWGSQKAVTPRLFLGWGMGEGLGEEGEWGRKKLSVSLAAAGHCSPDRFYGHCPCSGPQPPTPRFHLMAPPVWVKGQLDSCSFHKDTESNKRAFRKWEQKALSALCIWFLPLQLHNQFIN